MLARALDAGGGRAGHPRARRAPRRGRGGDRGPRRAASSPTRPTPTLRDALRAGELSTAGLLPRAPAPRLPAAVPVRRRGPRRCCSTPSADRGERERYDALLLDAAAAPPRRAPPRHAATPTSARRSSSSWTTLGDDEGCAALGLPALGSFLWSPRGDARTSTTPSSPTSDLLDAVRALAIVEERRRAARGRLPQPRRRGARLGLRVAARAPPRARRRRRRRSRSTTAAGNERKTTGSYYTPTSLIAALLDSALDPVLDEAARSRRRRGRDPRPQGRATRPAARATSSSPPPTASPSASPSVRTGDDEPSPEATTARAARRRRPLHLRRRRQPDGRRALQGQSSGWRRSSPGKPLSFLDAPHQVRQLPARHDPGAARRRHPRRRLQAARGRRQGGREGAPQAEQAASARASSRSRTRRSTSSADSQPRRAALEASRRRRRSQALHAKERRFARARCVRGLRAREARRRRLVRRLRPAQGRRTRRGSRPASSGASPVGAERLPDDGASTRSSRLAARVRASSTGTSSSRRSSGATSGGFDVVLGNPPWERVKLQEKEFFAGAPRDRRRAERRGAQAADRRARGGRSAALRGVAQPRCGRRRARATSSGRAAATRLRPRRRQHLRGLRRAHALADRRQRPGRLHRADRHRHRRHDEALLRATCRARSRLSSLFDFENEEFIFPAIHHATQVLPAHARRRERRSDAAEFVFFARQVADALTTPSAASRSRRGHRAAQPEHAHLPDLPLAPRRRDHEGDLPRVPCSCARATRTATRGASRSCSDVPHGERLGPLPRPSRRTGRVPLYEAKMIHHFDHRFGDYEGQTQAQANAGQAARADGRAARRPELLSTARATGST